MGSFHGCWPSLYMLRLECSQDASGYALTMGWYRRDIMMSFILRISDPSANVWSTTGTAQEGKFVHLLTCCSAGFDFTTSATSVCVNLN